MPGGGAQSVLGAMREQGLSAPVLVITGRLESHVLDELLGSGATACLHKPFTMSELMRATSALLSGAAAPPASPSQ